MNPATPADPWIPVDPQDIVQLLTGFDRPWWISGGWALDLHLGRTTREHADIDVGILRDDHLAMQTHLRGWELYFADAGRLTPWTAGDVAPPEVGGVWCRPAGATTWSIDLMLNPGSDDRWISRRNAALSVPMDDAIRRSDDGIPYLAPELQLFMKAKGQRPKDDVDFTVVAPTLDGRAQEWLRSALDRTHPDHPWIAQLP
jgi:hypothetical protein